MGPSPRIEASTAQWGPVKILLVSPCQDLERRTPGSLQIPQIALNVLAALTDPRHEVRIIEEEFEDLDPTLEPDLVGLSLMTANAPRGYLLADRFRAKGAKVVIGGMHPSILPEEALPHADAVVCGEGEELWPEVVADLEAGRSRGIYRCLQPVDLTRLPFPRRDLMPKKRFLNIAPVMTTRGCPYACEFCSVSRIFGRKVRTFPIDWVVEDIKRSACTYALILDDNVIGRPDYAAELFKAIAPLGIRWVGQASMSFADRTDLMELARKSGCRGLFFGMETVSEASMKRMKKSYADLGAVRDAIRRIQGHGIAFHASVVFGFDTDEPDIFEETLAFLMQARVFSTTFNILTPYPGTEVYDRFKAEGRLFSEEWQFYDHTTVVYRPRRMSPLQLAQGHLETRRRFYRLGSILRRLPANRKNPLIYLAMNAAFRSASRRARLPLASGGALLGTYTPGIEGAPAPAAKALSV